MDQAEIDADVKALGKTVDAFNAELLRFVEKHGDLMDISAYVQRVTDDARDQSLRVRASRLYAKLGEQAVWWDDTPTHGD